MKNKLYTPRYVSIFVVFIMLFTILSPNLSIKTYAYENEENTIKGSNSFIEYLVDKNDGRFIIRSVEGVPQKASDDNKKLLFDRDNDPETSFTTFRVDGKDYIFGNKYSGHSDYISNSQIASNGLYTELHWSIDGIDIKEILEVIEDPNHPNVGNVRIRYEAKNTSNSIKNIGSRILLDTMLGSNDAASFVVSGNNVTHETELIGSDIPDYYRSSDDEFAPNIIGYGFLKGWGQSAPDKVIFAHYNSLSGTKWDYAVDNTIDFTTSDNIYEGADSSAAYYFNEKPLGVNETRVYETFYGIGDFSNYNSESDYAVLVNVPEKLTVNQTRTGYVENEFTVSVTIDNSMPASKNLTNVNIALLKRDTAFSDVDGQNYIINVPAISAGEVKTYEFKLSPKNANTYSSETVRVDVTSDNNINPVTGYDYILVPPINGALPNLQLEALAPSTIYFQGFREFSIKGKGFNMLTDKGLWNLYLVDQSNHELQIPDENISIESDEKLTITVYEDTLNEPTPVGEYRFKIVHSNNAIGTVMSPSDKAIEFSSDVKYQSRPYGVIYIEKRLKNDNFTYHIAAVNSADILSQIKSSLEDGNGVPALYRDAAKDTAYGPVQEIVLDIIGDAAQLTAQDGSTYYKVKTNNRTAIINSVIQYKDADIPMEIKKTNGIVTIEGDGTLQMVGGNEFWWTSFYTYIADGEDYEVSEIVDAEDDEETRSNVTIDFFDVGKVLTSLSKTVFDGFELEIRDVILLDEGASFGGMLSLEVPYGKPVPVEEEQRDPAEEEEEIENEIGEALSDLFLTDEEREAKTLKSNRSKSYLKILALLITEDGIMDKVNELRESSGSSPTEKAEIIYDLVLQSPELLLTIQDAVNGKAPQEDDEEDRKSVGVTIDVKKVIFGKKYGEDFIYDTVKYIGIDAEGEIKVVLPFGTQTDRDEAEGNGETQGVTAKVAVNTIEGEYSIEADVNLKMARAHALVSIVKVDDRLVPDHIELSGGYDPGIPVAPPFFINNLGGGVSNLSGQFGNKDSGPLTIILILGINFEPSFQGDFRAEITKNGFSLAGEMEFKNGGMKIFKNMSVALQWSRPRYFTAEASVELFDIIEGNASLFVGEIEDGNTYKFYFKGRIEASLKIPDDVLFVGGKQIGNVILGASSEKLWGSIKVLKLGVGITYYYGKEVNFSVSSSDEFPMIASTADINIPQNAIYKKSMEDDQTLVIGSNIRKIGQSNVMYASLSNDFSYAVIANADDTQYQYNILNRENALFELKYTGDTPVVTVTDPSGNVYPLVLDENYLLQTIPSEISQSGQEEKYIFISVINPENGIWNISSDTSLDQVDVFEAMPIPKLNSLSFSRNADNIDVSFTATNNTDALVSLYLVNSEDESEAGYLLASDIDANIGLLSTAIPENIQEGAYKIRAVIRHPDYGYDELISTQALTIVDELKPSDITNLNVSYIGDGYLKATWNELVEAGDIEYNATVYDSNNVAVEGFKNMIVSDNKLVVGGSYNGTDALGNPIQYSLNPGASYKIGITPIKTITAEGSDVETIHVGNEGVSAAVLLKAPNPPNISVTYNDSYTDINGKRYFGTKNVEVVFSSDQYTDTIVTLDGEYFATFKNKNTFTLPLEFVDGEHKIRYECKNSYGDTNIKTITFITDTTKPELLINSPSNSMISENGTVLVKGLVESGARVYLGDNQLATASDGSFETTYNMPEGQLKAVITIRAEDEIGNKTEYSAEVINGTIRPIKEIKITNNINSLLTDSSIKLNVTGLDENGTEVKLNNADMKFTIIKGASIGNISKDGVVTAYDEGTFVVMASYALTDTYALEDAIEIETTTKLDYVQIIPEITQLRVGQSVRLGLVGGSKFNEFDLPGSNTTYRIISGSEYAELAQDVLFVRAVGAVTIEAVYDDGINTVSGQMTITINPPRTKPNDNEDTSNISNEESGIADENADNTTEDASEITEDQNSDTEKNESDTSEDTPLKPDENGFYEASEINIIDSILDDIWKNLVESESNIELITIREILKDLDTKVTIHDIGQLEIQNDTLSSDDQLLVGTERDEAKAIDEANHKLVGNVVELSFKDNGGKLNKAIKLALTYDKDSVESVENLAIYYYNELFGKWQYLGGENDIESETINILLNHLSKYAIMEAISNESFIDIKNHFAEDYIKSLYSLNVVEGEMTGGYRYYSPNRKLSRLEFAAIAVRVYEKLYPEKAAEAAIDNALIFEDDDQIAAWGKEYVKRASAYGLIEGTLIGNKRYFMPKNSITRAEAFTIIGRAIGKAETVTQSEFNDKDTIPKWAEAYIYKMIDLKIIDGYPDKTIRPNNDITRGEIAKVIYYWIEQRIVELK